MNTRRSSQDYDFDLEPMMTAAATNEVALRNLRLLFLGGS
jgi:hypothetical protein